MERGELGAGGWWEEAVAGRTSHKVRKKKESSASISSKVHWGENAKKRGGGGGKTLLLAKKSYSTVREWGGRGESSSHLLGGTYTEGKWRGALLARWLGLERERAQKKKKASTEGGLKRPGACACTIETNFEEGKSFPLS